MNAITKVNELFGGFPDRPPVPFAHFVPHRDCIRIIIRDCSYCEHRLNAHLTLIIDNYPEEGQKPIVGLVVKGVRLFFESLGLPGNRAVRVAEVLDCIAKQSPELLENGWHAEFGNIEDLQDLMTQTEMTVDISEPVAA
ncbi:MAG: hypothetical protein ABL994_20300 [Verrucomicrobiales bacterium]